MLGAIVVLYAFSTQWVADLVEERQTTPMTFMPDADARDKSSDAIRELLGRAYYAIKR